MTSVRKLFEAATAGVQRHLSGWISGAESQLPAPIVSEKERLWANLLTTPNFFPLKFDAQRDKLLFVEMTRESFRQSVFLDDRTVRSGPRTLSVELKQLKLLPVRPERPLHFILHGAFCGSTLLARHLEELPHGLVLKEPQLLLQLAGQGNNRSISGPRESDSWDDQFDLAIALLSRAYPSDMAVIIKAADLCNWMGGLLLDHDRRTKIVFLCSPLKEFLLSVLKVDGRRRWVRKRVNALKGCLAQVPFLSEIALADLSDGQCGAVVWLLNCFICSSLLARSDSGRIYPLSSAALFDQPQQTLAAVADFLGLTRGEATAAALGRFNALSYYSKDINRETPYDATTRANELGDIEKRFGKEVEAAIAWACHVSAGWLSRSPFSVE